MSAFFHFQHTSNKLTLQKKLPSKSKPSLIRIKGNANNGRIQPYFRFPSPFPVIAFINEETAGCINEEAIGAINEAAIGIIIVPRNPPSFYYFMFYCFSCTIN